MTGSEAPEPAGAGRRPAAPGASGRRRFLAVLVPAALSLASQAAFIQRSGEAWLRTLGEVATPWWALAVVPVARYLQEAATRHGRPLVGSESVLATRLVQRRWAVDAAVAAQAGAVVIVLLTYAREWNVFGIHPGPAWLAVPIAGTFALLLVPAWWIRVELHRAGSRYLDGGRIPERIDRFLFEEDEGRPARWPHVLAFALVTMVVAFTLLGQLDSLLRGMHLPDAPSVGINGLAGIDEFDLGAKLGVVTDRVGVWREYTSAVGGRFGSAYSVVTTHAVVDTAATIPAYLAVGLVLAFVAWRRRLRFAAGSEIRRAFELVVLSGLVVLCATALLDVGKNLLTWFVMDRAWNDPAALGSLPVRLLWGCALVRTIGLWLLMAACLLLLALSDTSTRRLRRALVGVRSELLLLGVLAVVVLMLPQTADVIRGWRISHAMITVALAVMLGMLVRWTAVRNLRLQHHHWRMVEAGDTPEPRRVRLPWGRSHPGLGTFAGGLVVVLAAAQVVASGLGAPVGTGLVIPAMLVGGFWLFGLALPAAGYLRGDRPVPVQIRRRLPRMLGSAVFLIVGVAVLKAAATSVAYARHEDWWLAFALVPPAIGVWRIASRSTATMGALEAAFAVVVGTLVTGLLVAGDPELSPATLAFAGITFAYGSLAFFNSYERSSLVNRVSARFLSHRWAKPFVAAALAAGVGTLLWFYADPIAVAPRIGTVGMTLMAMMVLTLLGAGAVRFAELTRPPRILGAFGIRRMPVVTLLVVWMILAPSLLDQRTTNVRTVEDPVATPAGLGFEDVWDRWAAANLPGPDAAGGERPVVPLVLISSSGGGLRAAAWTSFVLDCVFEGAATDEGPCGGETHPEAPLQRVAVMSGVSGGSLGLGSYVAHVLDGVEGAGGSNTWIDERLTTDFLAAPIGWLFFVDLPRSLLGFGPGLDNRADLMERAWEDAWPGDVPGLRRGLVGLWSEDPAVPPLVFTGISVSDGCRANLSALDVDGGSPEVPSCSGLDDGRETADGRFGATHDLVDYLCPGEDLPLSTAASLSARFPVVAVAGRLADDAGRSCPGAERSPVYVADGGYLEGSGAGTLLDAWEGLRDFVERQNASGSGACVVPFMLHIDNGYESPQVVGSRPVPREALVPLLAVFNSSSGITMARAEAALAFEQPFTIGGEPVGLAARTPSGDEPVTSRYVRLVTRAHPGVQAPLGWTLSQASIDDLRDQLAIDENAAGIAEVRRWLQGDIVCTGG